MSLDKSKLDESMHCDVVSSPIDFDKNSRGKTIEKPVETDQSYSYVLTNNQLQSTDYEFKILI